MPFRLASPIALAVAAMALSGPAQAQDAWKSLCRADESPWSGCTLEDGRTLTFCVPAGEELQQTSGASETPRVSHMTYRIAGTGGKIEFAFPKSRAGSAGRFRVISEGYSRGARTVIAFSNGAYSYKYEDTLIARAQGEGHDVTHEMNVWKGQRRVAKLKCRPRSSD